MVEEMFGKCGQSGRLLNESFMTLGQLLCNKIKILYMYFIDSFKHTKCASETRLLPQVQCNQVFRRMLLLCRRLLYFPYTYQNRQSWCVRLCPVIHCPVSSLCNIEYFDKHEDPHTALFNTARAQFITGQWWSSKASGGKRNEQNKIINMKLGSLGKSSTQ